MLIVMLNDAVTLNENLATLGYLEAGAPMVRALTRFQRHAKRIYRKTAAGESMQETPVYNGPEDGVAHPATLDEIARWLLQGFRLPLGYFKLATIGAWGALREDAARAWLALMARIQDLGGTIEGPYGDTKRPLMTAISVGASKYSFHIPGRAVDLNQGNDRYFVICEPQGAQMWWRLLCKTADQTGSQGQKFEVGSVPYHNFWTHQELPLPAGYYLDLTQEIEAGGEFERICAQSGWERDSREAEWWHFQWVPAKQATFQDECELVGITEKELRTAGYADAALDHAPG
jgi:hypothetical protein